MKGHGVVLARNAGLNFIGQVVPLAIGVVAIPIILRGLGTEAFGLLSLAWVILGYIKVFDLGLGPAITRFVAGGSAISNGERLSAVVWTALSFQFLLGLTGAILLAIATPYLVERLFNIPSALVPAAHTTFILLAASLPLSLASAGLKGVLEGHQWFGPVNAIQVPANASLFLVPVLGLHVGLGLPGIMTFLLVARLGVMVAYLVVVLRAVPALRRFPGIDVSGFRSLLAFGSWVTLSNVLGPILLYLDRLLISSVLSMSMLAYYHASYEIATRLWIVPFSLFTALFPAFSALRFDENRETIGRIFAHAVKSSFLLTMPLVLVLVMFADGLLTLWLGEEFARHGTGVLRILALGVLFNSLGWVPYAFTMGLGRPDIQFKIILLELPLYAGLAAILIMRGGIEGVAIAWVVMNIMYTILIFAWVWRVFSLSPGLLLASGLARAFGSCLVVAAAAAISTFLDVSFRLRSLLLGAMLAFLAAATWLYVFDGRDRRVVGGILSLHGGAPADGNSWSGRGP